METVVFYIFSILAIASLWMILRVRQIVHAISWFAVFLIIIAVFFGLLRAPFLALGQLVIFTGGMVAILLIGISFSGMESGEQIGKPLDSVGFRSRNIHYKILSLFFLLTMLVSLKLFFAKDSVELPVKNLALQIFGTYWPIIAIILLMFLAALLSAVFFLKKEDEL